MKILKGILSSILATILVGVLTAFIAYLSVRAIVSKKGVDEIFDKVNLSDVLVDSKGNYTKFGQDIKEQLVENGVPAEVIDDFVDAEELTDFFSDYAGDAVNFIVYDEELDKLKADDITKLMNDNIDAIVENLRERKVEGYEELTDERVQQIKDEIPELAKGIEEKMPDVNKFVEESDFSTPIKVVRIVFSKTMVLAFALIVAIISLLIILLNLKNFKWGIWLGVTTIIASLPFVIAGCLKGVIDIDDSKALEDVVKYLIDKLSFTGLLFLIGGIALIVLTIVARIIKKSIGKKAGKVSTPAEPVKPEPITEETTVVAEEVAPEAPVTEEPVVEETVEVPVTEEAKEETPVETASEAFCSECGAKLNAGQNFCYNCGATKK